MSHRIEDHPTGGAVLSIARTCDHYEVLYYGGREFAQHEVDKGPRACTHCRIDKLVAKHRQLLDGAASMGVR